MLPRADLSTPAVSRVDGASAIGKAVEARQQVLARALSPSLGKVLQADILSKFNDGSFLVKVGGINARMQLPDTAQVGRQVALTLVAIAPRPAFELASQPGVQTYADPTAEAPADKPRAALPDSPGGARVGSGAHAAALLAKAPLLPAAQLGAMSEATAAPTLTETGKVLANVLAAVQQGGAAPAALVGRAPLLAGPPAAPAALAAALQDTMASSGLFYESHVAEWAGGQRPRADLVQEPQMQRATQLPTTEPGRSASPAESATAQLVNLQLHTQEQARVAWQGQAWPGQDLRWDVAQERPDEQRAGAGADAEPGWRSSVKLRFALLGEINARVVLRGDNLHIQIDAGNESVGALLRQHAGALGLSLDAAGTPLASLAIRSDESA